MTQTDSLVGKTVGRYRIESVLGRGGMGVVYLARDNDHVVALKLMAPEVAGNASFRERFLREAEVTLDHPHVVPVYEAGEADGELYIAMRYVAGADLKKLILSENQLEPGRVVAVVEQAAAALDFAHENRIVHRDVKPQNILIEEDDGSESAYLTDFGLIKRISPDSSFTTGPYLMGTVYYMAPEQIAGKAVDGRADVYSLGCIAYECLTGSVPYDFETEAAVLWAHMNSATPAITDDLPLLPTEVDAVIAKAMAKSPEDRFLTAGELSGALGTSLGVSVGRSRSVWGSRMSASGRHRRPAAVSPAPVSVAEARSVSATKGFLVGAAAILVALGLVLSARSGSPPRPVSDGSSSPTTAEEVLADAATGPSSALSELARSAREPNERDSRSVLPDSAAPGFFPLSEGDAVVAPDEPNGPRGSRAPVIPSGALEQDCYGVAPFFYVPVDRVAPYVDDRFTIATKKTPENPVGNLAEILTVTFTCGIESGDESFGRSLRSIVGVTIEKPNASPPGVVELETYVLAWFESNRRVLQWYEAAPGIGARAAEWIPTIAQRQSSGFYFRVPPPASSPFTITADVGNPTATIPEFVARWWIPRPRGALRIQDSVQRFGFVEADVTLAVDDARPNSLLERLFAPDHSRTYGDVAAGHVGDAITTKKVVICGEKC